MDNLLSIPLFSRQSARRAARLPVSLVQGRSGGVQATADGARNDNRSDQGEGQCATVLQIIERVCASHQEQLGCYPFLAWGDFQRHL